MEIHELLALKAVANAKLKADTPLLEARSAALSQEAGAAMEAQCAGESGLPFVWFHSQAHVQQALSGNTSHPRIFWGHIIPEVLPIGFAYYDLAGDLLGAMLPPTLATELCIKVWPGANLRTQPQRGVGTDPREVLGGVFEAASALLKNLFHVHLGSAAELTAVLTGEKLEHLALPVDHPFGSEVQKCNRTARFRHRRVRVSATAYMFCDPSSWMHGSAFECVGCWAWRPFPPRCNGRVGTGAKVFAR